MSKDTFTEKETWEAYWSKYVPEIIGSKNQFQSLFEGLEDGKGVKSFIEIGGFPGTFAIYFKKFKHYKVSLLDYFISQPIINSLLSKNDIKENELEVIESDIFNFDSHKKYDLVFSSGFIEHFHDIEKVIKAHVDLLESSGQLLITLPNLTGLNGWIQEKYDMGNYNIHNIECMNINKLRKICEELGLENIEVDFYGKPTIWLEHTAPVGIIFRKIVKYVSLSLKLFPIKGAFLSPFIYIKANKE
jgi:SAM-dependent methyltransferase